MSIVASSVSLPVPVPAAALNEDDNRYENNTITTKITFKLVYTCQTVEYNIPLSWKISEFIENVTSWTKEHFNLNYVEIVEAGKNIADTQKAEDAPPLLPDSITIEKKYYNILNNLSFYVRPYILTDCVICLEEEQSTTCHYGCGHSICRTCLTQSINHGLTRCPICRRPQS